MSRRFGPLIFLPLVLAASPAGAATFERSTELQFYGDYRRFDRTAATGRDETGTVIGVFGENLNYSTEAYQLDFRPELRAAISPSISAGPNDIGRISMAPPSRLFDLDTELARGVDSQIVATIERVSVSYQTERAEVYAGRKPVSLGVLRIFPVWNKFSRVLPFQPAILQFNTSDTAGLRYQFGEYSARFFGIGARDMSRDGALLGEFTYFGPAMDWLGLAGRWWSKNVLGLAFVKDWEGLAIRNEFLAIGVDSDRPEYQNGLGFEYAFNESLSAILEFLYLSWGEDKKQVQAPTSPSRFMPLKSRLYAYGSAQYKFTPVWTANAGLSLNIMDGSVFANTSATRSLSDSMDLIVEFKAPFGAEEAEFSSRSYYIFDDLTLGYPTTVAASLRWVF